MSIPKDNGMDMGHNTECIFSSYGSLYLYSYSYLFPILSVYLSICLCLCLSVCLSLSLSLSLYIYIYIYIWKNEYVDKSILLKTLNEINWWFAGKPNNL